MSIIFLGDIASPSESISNDFGRLISQKHGVFQGKKIICNFEGLAFNEPPVQRNEPLLYNHTSVLNSLGGAGGAVLGLANNHVLDYPQQYNQTIELSHQKGFITCGAGRSREEAECPVEFYSGGQKIILFNACWDFLLYNNSNPRKGVYVAEINEEKIIQKVGLVREKEAGARIVIYLHWNLDMETLPFPLYRQFARDLIDAGAGLVLGSHSHCVQGGEKFGDGYVIYGLGNFLIPDNEYANGNLRFPALSKTELAIEWNPVNMSLTCHWFEYKGKEQGHGLVHVGSEKFEESKKLHSFSPFRNMEDHEYVEYFKKHRRKKLLIPVYKDYKKVTKNKLYTMFLKLRARTAHFLATLRLVGWQN
jgi:hypothetical protein